MDPKVGNMHDRGIEQASYKKNFFKSIYAEKSANLPQIWNSGDQADLSNKVIDRKEKKALLSKVIQPHDIWHSKQYGTNEFKPLVYKTVYRKDFEDKYQHTLDLNKEVATQENNMGRTVITEYSNAKHNREVFVNPRFLSC